MKRRIIKDMDDLKKLAGKEEGCDCFILLNYNLMSRKQIQYNEGAKKPFFVLNLIDGTEQNLTEKELGTKSNIAEALSKKALILEE
jgi:hypothetical protein